MKKILIIILIVITCFNIRAQNVVSYATIESAIASIGPAEKELNFSAGIYLGVHTFPSNITLRLMQGAIFTDSIKIKGGLIASISEHFSTTVDLDSAKTDESYPEWFGAKADSSTNNTLYLNRFFASMPIGGIAQFQQGTYLCDSTVTISKPGVIQGTTQTKIILIDSIDATNGLALFHVTSSNVTIKGFEIYGTFYNDTTLQYAGRKLYETGIAIDAANASNYTLENITVEEVTFRNFAHYGFRLLTNDSPLTITKNLKIKNCNFYNNFTGLQINGYGHEKDITLDHLIIDGTALRHSTTPGEDGGNGITTINGIENLQISNCSIKNVGRMTIEVWFESLDSVQNSIGTVIQNNKFFQGLRKTISIGGTGLKFNNNTVVDSLFALELYGEGLQINANTFYYCGLQTQLLISPFNEWRGWSVIGNEFWGKRTPLITLVTARDFDISHNSFHYEVATDTTGNIFNFQNVFNSKINYNNFYFKTDSLKENKFSFSNFAYSQFSGNNVFIDSLTKLGYALVSVNNSFFSTYENNKFIFNNPTRPALAPFQVTARAAENMHVWYYNGTAWTLIDSVYGWRTAPIAGDSVTNRYFMIKSKPSFTSTYPVSNQEGKLAKYNGTTWLYYTIDDVIINPHNLAAAAQFYDFRLNFPTGSTGDTILVIEDGVIGNIFAKNDFDVNNVVYPSTDFKQDFQLRGGATGVFWNNYFIDNISNPEPLDIALWKGNFSPLSGNIESPKKYYWQGQSLQYFDGVTNSLRLRYCTVAGVPGTWSEFPISDTLININNSTKSISFGSTAHPAQYYFAGGDIAIDNSQGYRAMTSGGVVKTLIGTNGNTVEINGSSSAFDGVRIKDGTGNTLLDMVTNDVRVNHSPSANPLLWVKPDDVKIQDASANTIARFQPTVVTISQDINLAAGKVYKINGVNPLITDGDKGDITISSSGTVFTIDNGAVAYSELSGIPSTFTPEAHNQAWSTITSTPTTIAGYGITDIDAAIAAYIAANYTATVLEYKDHAGANQTITVLVPNP